jgi:ribosomal protein S12 methylthiotransferase
MTPGSPSPSLRARRRSPKLRAQAPPIISLVSLGCAKNLVDSERILAQFAEAGFLIAQEPAQADLCLVNTCGFIQEARDETAGVLRELAALKPRSRLRLIAALGCLVERAGSAPETSRALAGADLRLGFRDYPRLAEICRKLLRPGQAAPRLRRRPFLLTPRLRIGAPHTAYLKIAEGCSNFCRYCAIPLIRGRQVSRPIGTLVAEAQQLVAGGARELNLIAQDTASYGRDLYGRPRLARLLRALARALPGPTWLRILYSHPRHLSREILEVLASDGRFCPYLDIPLQHIADPLLETMGRGITRRQVMDLLELIRRILPDAALRTTFLVGFPGETRAHFKELLGFVGEGHFSHAGVFAYSPEQGTKAAELPGTVPLAEKQRRREALLLAQREVSRARLRRGVGKIAEILVEGRPPPGTALPRGARAVARSRLEAPEVDGLIFLRGATAAQCRPGQFRQARIVAALDYDLVAEVLPARSAGPGAVNQAWRRPVQGRTAGMKDEG